MATTAELKARDAFVRCYATKRGMTVEELLKWRRAIPARLEGPCDYSGCKGWHMLPVGFYTKADVDSGFINEEVLEWI